MARRNNRLSIPAGPDWTDAFRSEHAGGADGAGGRDILLTCAADSAVPLEYRVENPADPDGEAARLAAGEAARLDAREAFLIHHVVMRGVGGVATGGVEVLGFGA